MRSQIIKKLKKVSRKTSIGLMIHRNIKTQPDLIIKELTEQLQHDEKLLAKVLGQDVVELLKKGAA